MELLEQTEQICLFAGDYTLFSLAISVFTKSNWYWCVVLRRRKFPSFLQHQRLTYYTSK